MQQAVHPIPRNPSKFAAFPASGLLATLLGLLTVLPGCGPMPTQSGESKPFASQKLTLRCPDAAFAKAITPAVKAWEARKGAAVAVVGEAMTPADDTDVGVIPAPALGEWGEAGLLAAVPPDFKKSDNPFQWFTLLSPYSDRFVEWGGQTLAVPLTGDGHVLVYRADRLADKTTADEFQKRFGRAPAAPATWEEFADLALFFAERDKKPSLPPLPAAPDAFLDLFNRIASSADRRALTDVEVSNRVARDRDALAFQFSAVTGKPRLASGFGFQQAAKWLERVRPALPGVPPGAPPDDPVAALADGMAVLAVLSLEQLARLPRENGVVPARFALVAVPGTRHYFDADKGAVPNSANVNYVPYFAGGRLGVVRSRCPHPEAAFDLLSDLGSPARGAEFVATPGLGAGPLRVSQLDRDRLLLWLGYGFDEPRSRALQDALRQYVSQTVKNPTFALRGPDRAALVPVLAEPLRKAGAGAKPEDALREAETAWNALDAKVNPPEKLLRWRRLSIGQ
jgi:ABC-type glycerol-3-phosphate transport system substrate-binding protein